MAPISRIHFLWLGLLVAHCAQPRPLQPVLPDSTRIEKSRLQGTFLFLKTIVDVTSPGPDFESYAPGLYDESDKLVRFELAENGITVASVDPLYTSREAAPINQRLATFPALHVDVERKQNFEGDPTHEEEETLLHRPWNERKYVRVDFTRDELDDTQPYSRTSHLDSEVIWDPQREYLQFAVRRELKDGTGLLIRYSFLRYQPSRTYEQRPYPLEDQLRFGLFKTTAFALDEFDRFTDGTRLEFMNRWDTSKSIVFHFGPDFPDHLKPMVRRHFSRWADVLASAVGDRVLVGPLENTGQALGDLRYNLIHYDNSDHSAHGILGYAPHYTNPRTGEILKADIVLFGRVLKRAVFHDLFGERSRRLPPPPLSSDERMHPNEAQPTPLQARIKSVRGAALSDLKARITRLTPTLAKEVLQASPSEESIEQVESRLFSGVFAHELGHALGLRHNFMASSDRSHYEPGETASSVMDYGFLHGHRGSIGPYDRAALTYAYSPLGTAQTKALKAGYLFCSDEDVFSARLPLCQLYDSGHRLENLVLNQLDRYLSSYEINNLRLDRPDFQLGAQRYEERVLALLLPIRLAYDNAHALLQAYGRKDYPSLWALARQRIEVDSSTHPSDLIVAEVDTGLSVRWSERGPGPSNRLVNRYLDRFKIQDVIDDARHAKDLAVEALKRVVLDASRPDFDRTDKVRGDLQSRGVLVDKLLALSLIAAPTEHPLISGRTISPYSVSERVVPELFASLLSNTAEVQDPKGGEPYYRIRQFDMNLRKAALDLLANQVAQVGRYPEARESIRLNALKVPAGEPGGDGRFVALKDIRLEFRDFYRDRVLDQVLQTREVPEGEFEFSFSDVSPFEHTRNAFDLAYTQIDDTTWYTAPLSLPVDGLKTASGLFIRNNLNVAEDYLEALNHAQNQLQQNLFSGRGGITTAIALKSLDKRRDALRRYVAGEQLFLQQMYMAFTQEWRPPR